MCNVSYVSYSTSTCIPLCRYNDFLICLAMVRPMQVDGIWDKRHFAYNKDMASLLPREIYYRLQRLLRTDVTDLIEECNATWSAAWRICGAVCGDEAVVPHSGGRCLGPRQYIARKPRSMGIKLYVIADNGGGYVFDVYLYTGRRSKVCRFGSCCGKYDAKGIMRLWAKMIPQFTVLCADSFFGSHGLAKEFAAQRRPFLMLSKRDKRDAGLTRAAALPQEGDMARAIVADKNYELAVYKNPKVGHKPPRLVPFLTNCWYAEEVPKDRRGNPLPPVVVCYREFSRAVDGANQMALQMRRLGRQMTWRHAVRAFMVRYAAGNAFATAKALGLVDDKTTMWEFQCDILKQRYFSGREFNSTTPTAAVPTVHAPKRFASRLLCTHCRNGSTRWACGACGKHMHIKCFGDAHDV